MATMTTPKDLVKPVPQVDSIIQQIEAEFKKNPKMHTHNVTGRPDLLSVYYIITIQGGYHPEDIDEVIRRYKDDAGWKNIEVYRSYDKKNRTVPAISTKIKFYEIY